MSPDGVLMGKKRSRNQFVFAASFFATVALSAALVILVFVLRDVQTDGKELKRQNVALEAQIRDGDAVAACRSRFISEDERVDRGRSNWVAAALSALANDDAQGVATASAVARGLASASIEANQARIDATETCTADPNAQPTRHTIPALPT